MPLSDLGPMRTPSGADVTPPHATLTALVGSAFWGGQMGTVTWVEGLGMRVWGLGFRVWGLGLRVWDSGCWVEGVKFRD